jgi:hypothetical protein
MSTSRYRIAKAIDPEFSPKIKTAISIQFLLRWPARYSFRVSITDTGGKGTLLNGYVFGRWRWLSYQPWRVSFDENDVTSCFIMIADKSEKSPVNWSGL